MRLRTLSLLVTLLLGSLSVLAQDKPADVTVEELATDIRTLSSDVYSGRGLGSKGLEKAVKWHESAFKELGLKPLFGESYRQPFTLLGATPDPKATLKITVPSGKATSLKRLEEFVTVSWNKQKKTVEASVVYAGHLIVAHDRNWDDVKEIDLKGKILLVDVNEPGNRDKGIFEGTDMTLYGRWTYKFEEAARQGAAGILLIHNDKRAGYQWNVVRTGWSNEDFFSADRPETNLGFMGWIPEKTAKTLLKQSGKSLSILRSKAERDDFEPIELGMVAKVTQKPKFREVDVANVSGWLPSAHPDTNDRYVIISAHFDHLGRNRKLKDDQIFNGAVDNCAATAAMMGVARHFSRHPDSVPFHLVFVGVTAEETGLLGSRWFVEHMPFPIGATWANINHEMTNVWGRTKNVFVYGAGFSELTAVARAAAQSMGLEFLDSMADTGGMSFRSDQLSFARAGIPAVWLHEGTIGIDGKRDALAKRLWYLANRYHQVSDEVDKDWDLEGTLQMVEWSVAIIRELAKQPQRPKMKPGSGMATAAPITSGAPTETTKLPSCEEAQMDVRRRLDANRNHFRHCYERELGGNPKLQGKLLLNITVAPDGSLDTIAFEQNTLNHAKVQNCIIDKARNIKFTPCTGDLRRKRLPLSFKSQ
jgi:Zn-dependent M28 family amino/carboxypeptidase